MRMWIMFGLIIGCILLVGYIEDPCITEGLDPGFMD